MNTKAIKFIIPSLLSVLCMTGCGKDNDNNNTLPSVTSYYSGIDLENDFGQYLVEELHDLMWTTHTKEILYSQYMSYESNTAANDSIDLIPGTNKNQSFYSGSKVSFKNGTREHVWPCANSGGLWSHDVVDLKGYIGGGSDLFHVRPCNSSTNTLRGNSKFVDFDDQEFEATVNEGHVQQLNYESTSVGSKAVKVSGAEYNTNTKKYEYASLIEVDDSFKGDVARILAYLWLHYQRCSTTPEEQKDKTGALSFKSVVGYSDEEKCKQKLVEWNKLDPVSNVEKHRNDTVQKIQGNRNPFVDYPDLMENCFGLIEEDE